VTTQARVPLAFYCGPSHDSDPGPALVTAFSADGTPHSERVRRDQRDEEVVALVRKALAKVGAAQKSVGPDDRSPSVPARR
jgi:hypothetical protein